MSEYIMNRESLKRHCEAMCHKFKDIPTSGTYGEHRFVLDLLEQTEWIPVSERLPELTIHDFGMSWSDYVLVYGITVDGEYGIAITQFCEEENEERGWCDAYIHIETGKIDDVIAWMPLPQPYEPQERSEE